MNVIITGGTSFIGLAVTGELLRRGDHVWTIVRPGSPNRGKLPVHDHLHQVELGLEDMERLPERLGGGHWDGFLHMAWDGVGSAGRSDRLVQEENIRCSLEAVKAAARLGCCRFLFSGSQAEYGICRERTGEDHPCAPVSEYGKAKLEFGRQAKELCRRLGMDYVHTRIFSVYGPGDHPWSLVSSCLRTFSQGGHMELGECTQHWNFLYIEDMARAMAALLGAPGLTAGVYNIAGEDTRVLREFVEQMHRICGGRGTYQYGRRPPNAEGPASLLPDVGKLERAVGWRPEVTFEEGIRRTLAAAEGQAGERI